MAAVAEQRSGTIRVKFVGDRHRRKEDPRLLTGRGRYVGDIALPGMLHAVLLRSPHAHARIVRVDAARAREHPGVVDVVTFGDLGLAAQALPIVPPHPQLRGHNFYPLAGERVRFVGEAVAVIVAESRYAGEDARDLVEVEYEPLPSAQGLGPAEPAVHDDVPDNVAGRVTLACGDVEAALRSAPRVRATRLRSGAGAVSRWRRVGSSPTGRDGRAPDDLGLVAGAAPDSPVRRRSARPGRRTRSA